jgi:hypothetical protein
MLECQERSVAVKIVDSEAIGGLISGCRPFGLGYDLVAVAIGSLDFAKRIRTIRWRNGGRELGELPAERHFGSARIVESGQCPSSFRRTETGKSLGKTRST